MAMPAPTPPVHLAVALDGCGWHPAAWREPDARPAELFTARYWADLTGEAERGLLDFVTFEDSLSLQSDHAAEPDPRTDQVRGRLDAVLVAARVAPVTRGIGLIPTVVVTHTEPFHVSKAIATLDYISGGRAGLQVKVSARRDEAGHFGRRSIPPVRAEDADDPATARLTGELCEEGADYVEVVRRLWDSWEDDAEIRDVATGRFVDRDKLHYIDFQGRWFSVRGPSITPRPPQGQPVVSAQAPATAALQLVARAADVGYLTPSDAMHARRLVAETGRLLEAADRPAADVLIFADLLVFLDGDEADAAARKARLDERAGREYRSDAQSFCGTPAQLADLLQDWQGAGLAGFRLRPAAIPHDLTQVTRGLVPELQRRTAFRREYEYRTLRGLLGLPRPASRYAARPAGRA
jgi:alkanesulfonate monooxygenase SsuD/methylene tetrahydromethanopterin reductase-like flavin-dependent oxidoreductase (luciferase family)